jgi:hypothetical protein
VPSGLWASVELIAASVPAAKLSGVSTQSDRCSMRANVPAMGKYTRTRLTVMRQAKSQDLDRYSIGGRETGDPTGAFASKAALPTR